jgi:hypothetical protein
MTMDGLAMWGLGVWSGLRYQVGSAGHATQAGRVAHLTPGRIGLEISYPGRHQPAAGDRAAVTQCTAGSA